MKTITCKRKLHITCDTIAELAFILYFANPLIRVALGWVFGGSSSITKIIAVLVIYTPVAIIFFYRPQKYFKADFAALFLTMILFFIFTLLLHPEYAPYYFREEYGVWDHVLLPYRGLYAYLFVRLINDPKRILSCLKKSGWCMIIYFVYEILLYRRQGYWYGVVGLNGKAEMSYSVWFGYEVLLYAITFLYCTLKEKKMIDAISTIVCITMIFIGGSRGPILFIGVFIALYVLQGLKTSRQKGILIFTTACIAAIVYSFYNNFLSWLGSVLGHFGFTSRFITQLTIGSISSDSGRLRIWEAAVNMIKENPWGYGAMGTRHVIAKIIYAGYPHSVILEILVDFGVIFGSVILLIFLINSILILFTKRREEWSGIFLIFFSTASCLFLSLTFWNIQSFWACIGIGVGCCLSTKSRNVRRYKRGKENG